MSADASPPNVRPYSAARRLARVALLVLVLWPATAPATPPVRLPEGKLATEYWDLVARLDSGHLLIAQTWLSNLGVADRSAGALGWLIAPGGAPQRFKRSEEPGAWLLTDGGRRIDLHSIALEPGGPTRRFEVGKDDLGVDLEFAGSAGPTSSGSVAGRCPFEVLEPSAPATVRLRSAAAAPVATQGRVALTHRWTTGLEAGCVLRRVEVFVLEPELGVYFSQTQAPDGSLHRWLVARRGGRILFQGDPGGESTLRWNETEEGFGAPLSLRFDAAGLAARVRFGAELAGVDPTDRLPRPMQWLVAARTRPRLTWLRAPFEISLDTGGGVRRSFAGEAVAKVSYMNPLPGGRLPSRVAVHSEE